MLVVENEDWKLKVDVSVPTDEQMSGRRPDLVIDAKKLKSMCILEVACAWEPLIKEREEEKRRKYQGLAADLANQKWLARKSPPSGCRRLSHSREFQIRARKDPAPKQAGC